MQTITITNNKEVENELLKNQVTRRINSRVIKRMIFGKSKHNKAELENYLVEIGEIMMIENYNLIIDPDYPEHKLVKIMEQVYNREIQLIHKI